MSVASVASHSAPAPAQDQDIDFWGSGLTNGGYSGLTKVETMRLATRLPGIAAAGTGVATIPLAALGVVTWQLAFFVAIPCAVVAGGVIWYNRHLSDYENPNELQKFSAEAARLSLDSVIQAYGWNDTLRFGILPPHTFAQKYRQQIQGKSLLEVIAYFEKTLSRVSQCARSKFRYEVPSPRESAGLWRQETATQTFEEIIRTYPLDKLEKYALVEQGELNCIKHLKREYEAIKESHDKRVTQANGDLRAYENRCAYADQTYYNNDAVRELQSFEFHYARKLQGVQDQRARTQINLERNERLMHLNDEEARAKERRNQMIDDAKRRYEADIRERHAPIDASFRSAADDFSGRYRAYLRIVAASN